MIRVLHRSRRDSYQGTPSHHPYSPKCPEGVFCELRLLGVLGSSLSSGAARRRLQICQEALEDDIGDVPLEASQCFLTRFALRYLLALVGSAPNVRPSLAGGDHLQSIIELAVSGQREPVAYHLATRGLHRRRSGVGGKVGLVFGKRTTLPSAPMIFAASIGPRPKISVRVVPEASTSASLCAHRDLRSFAAVCECRAPSPKPAAGGGGLRRPGTVCRARCMRLGGSRAFSS